MSNLDKIALDILIELIDIDTFDKLQHRLFNIIKNNVSSYEILTHYINDNLIDPTDLFYETNSERDAILLWEASFNTEYRINEFLSCWDEEDPIPEWKMNIIMGNYK